MKLSTAGKVHLVIELLGGQPVLDEYGRDTGEVTPALITWEQALELLNTKEEDIE